MANNELGKPRRSQVVYNYGPGAIVDFSAGGDSGAAVSVVVAGLEEWDRNAPPGGLAHPQVTFEPRLQSQLRVRGFRLPPINPENADAGNRNYLIGLRFPTWLQCPKCNSLKRAKDWTRKQLGDPGLYCSACESKIGGTIHVGPVRFVVACRAGHLDEFPWDFWVRHRKGCSHSNLRLWQSKKSGLAGLMLTCRSCGAERPMEGIFGQDTLREMGLRCRGQRPWLGGPAEGCDENPRVLQRGASNLYFPVTASALDIPPWSDQLHKRIGIYWEKLLGCEPTQRPQLISLLGLEAELGMTGEEILNQVERGVAALAAAGTRKIRFEEYEQFLGDRLDSVGEGGDFEIRPHSPPPELRRYLRRIVQVTRLREVRAIRAFTRIKPPTNEAEEDSPLYAPIRRTSRDWLPAIEVRGEGIFLQVDPDVLAEWETRNDVQKRAAIVHDAWVADWRARHGVDDAPRRRITPRFLLVHALAHALIRQLSLECGYSSASLRERLYVDTGELEMAGLLIYTATPDSDGTLGGLARQGLPARVAELVPSAIHSIIWCSNDPLCIRDIATFTDALNLAACHSCLMMSETSCEEFNGLLDRAMLIGLPDNADLGFFSGIRDAADDL